MSKPAGKNKNEYTFHPGRSFQLDWDELQTLYNDDDGSNQCYLVALGGREISLLLSMLEIFPKYHWVWGLPSPKSIWDNVTRTKWDEIQEFVSELEGCLMSGCNVGDLITGLQNINTTLETGLNETQQRLFDLNGKLDDINISIANGATAQTGSIDRLRAAVAGEDGPGYDYKFDGPNETRGMSPRLFQLELWLNEISNQLTNLNGVSVPAVNANLDRLTDINTVLGNLSELAALVTMDADLDALQNLGNLSYLQNINTILSDLHTAATAHNNHMANAVGELEDVNTDLDALTSIPDITSHLALLQQRFRTSNSVYPDENLADILAGSLVGRQLDVPFPWSGEGIADILDERFNELQSRLLMPDSSLFNLVGGEKNIVEALETLLRRDSIVDLELLPNVATILERSLNLGAVDTTTLQLMKNLVRALGAKGLFPESVYNWLSGRLDDSEQLSTADLLLLLVQVMQTLDTRATATTTVNVNNVNNCADGVPAVNGNGTNHQITLTDNGVAIEGPEPPPLLGGGG